MLRRKYLMAILCVLLIDMISNISAWSRDFTTGMTVPLNGVPTLVDIGARSCVPCEMMAPILQKIEKRYAKKAFVVYIDAKHFPIEVRRFELKGIPTQIFYDARGKEVYRHLGFMSEAAIVSQFKKMGIE